MIREQLRDALNGALAQTIAENSLGAMTAVNGVQPVIERPRSPEHGDYACGVALKLASQAKMAPLKIAESIAARLPERLAGVASYEVVAPGYINFRLEKPVLTEVLKSVHELGADYGRSEVGGGKRVLVEYVSANPTGDLHIGHGRNGVFGSSLANLMRFGGFKIEEEFYINDAGAQIQVLGQCAWAGYQRLLGKEVDYPTEGYPEDTLKEYLDQVIASDADKHLNLSDADGRSVLGGITKQLILEKQKKVLESVGIRFDRWFSETPLHQEGRVDQTMQRLRESNLVYDSEGALWLKAKELGDERDRVLVKSDGSKTYLAADAAYHLDKFDRGYDLLINIWGADHHGQVPGLKAVVAALGKNPDQLEVVLTQIVNLSQEGQTVRMSKRRGTVVLLEDLIDEVGRDAVRYYLAESSPQNPISFDLELAKKTSKENPAFYIQYAHARCCSILRTALEESTDPETGKKSPAPVSPDEWEQWQKAFKTDAGVFSDIFVEDAEVFAFQKDLIKLLAMLSAEVEEAVVTRQPGKLARYAFEVAVGLQKFYEFCRVITAEKNVTRARLGLVLAVRQVLANVLGVIGVTAVERM